MIRCFNCFKSSKKVFNFHRTNYFKLNQVIAFLNWESVFSSTNSVNNFISDLNYFYDKLNGFIAKCVPKRSVDTSNCPCWFTPELKSLKNRRNKIFNKYKLTNSNFYYIEYIKLIYSFSQLNSASYKNYLGKVKNNIKMNPKKIYDFVNSKRKSAVFIVNHVL